MFNPPQTVAGVPIFVSEHATTTEARFPDKKWSKRRRRRVIGKYGSWTIERPAAFRCGPAFYVHPKLYEKLKAETVKQERSL